MCPERPTWLHRWQQREDDELLYTDQALVTHPAVSEEYTALYRQQRAPWPGLEDEEERYVWPSDD